MAKNRPTWKDSDAPDANGKFNELSCGALAKWLVKSRKGNMSCPGWDQAHIFRYCESISYDYTHPDVGYGWNSCAKYGKMQKDGDTWKCKYTGPAYPNEDKTYDVHLNHYWWNFKPWQIDCPLFKEYE